MNTNSRTLGVVVGRFQTIELHAGHRHLIDSVRARCAGLLIALGNGTGWNSSADPMDYETRRLMIAQEYPDAIIVRIDDHPSDEFWSQRLGELIADHAAGYDEVVLFGSRDSFKERKHYFGEHRYESIDEIPDVSATKLRAEMTREPLNDPAFRQGVVYATTRQTFPTSFQAVDAAILKSDGSAVLVGRKTGEEGWRFPGGFVDPADENLEHAARREAREEVGNIELSDVRYVCSKRINDHRYRRSEHKVMSALFRMTYVYGPVRAGDDLSEVRWQDIDGLVDCLIGEHRLLAEALIASMKGKEAQVAAMWPQIFE